MIKYKHLYTVRTLIFWKFLEKETGIFTLDVNLPVNTTTIIILPSGTEITENGKPINKTKDKKIKKNVKAAQELLVPSGVWSSKVSLLK